MLSEQPALKTRSMACFIEKQFLIGLRIASKVINHFGDGVMKVFRV